MKPKSNGNSIPHEFLERTTTQVSKLRPVIIDSATIFDPSRLIAILASVDIRYSEVWVSQRYDHFKEKDFITGFGTESRIGLLPDEKGKYKCDPLPEPKPDEPLDPKHWLTGPKILRWALARGIVVPKNLYKYEQLAIELAEKNNIANISEAIMLGPPNDQAYEIRAGKGASELYKAQTKSHSLGPELSWRLEPYGIGHGLGLILATAQEEGVEPFLSHPHFFDQISTHNYTFYQKENSGNTLAFSMRDSQNENNIETSLKIDRDLPIAARLLSSSSTVQIGDVAFYLDQKDRIQSISAIIAASELLKSRPADCGIIASKFVGTTVLDATIFMGMPVSSSLVAAYELGVRWFREK
jgi:hypothetical protein